MIMEKLVSERYQTEKSKKGWFSFGVKLGLKKFIYLKTNPEQKKSLENEKNNFSSYYKIINDDGSEQNLFFSTYGITVFDSDWSNRVDYKLDRNDNNYRLLEGLEKTKDFESIEKIINNIIG